MAKTYTQQELQEYLEKKHATPGQIRAAINQAMENIGHTTIIQIPFRQKCIKYLGHDKFQVT